MDSELKELIQKFDECNKDVARLAKIKHEESRKRTEAETSLKKVIEEKESLSLQLEQKASEVNRYKNIIDELEQQLEEEKM